MKNIIRNTALLAMALLATALATSTASAQRASTKITTAPAISVSYEQVQSDLPKHLGVNVRWGGQIIGSQTIDNITRVTVLAYPLNAKGVPSAEQAIDGSAFAIDFDKTSRRKKLAEGNFITVFGPVVGGLKLTNGPLETLVPVITSTEYKKWNQRKIAGLDPSRESFAFDRARYYNSLGVGSLGFIGSRRGFSSIQNRRLGTFGSTRLGFFRDNRFGTFGNSRFGTFGNSRFGTFGSSRFGHRGTRGFSRLNRFGRY